MTQVYPQAMNPQTDTKFQNLNVKGNNAWILYRQLSLSYQCQNCFFYNLNANGDTNPGKYGGAIYMYNDRKKISLTIENSNFSQCTSTDGGGAVWFQYSGSDSQDCNINISNSYFSENSITGTGQRGSAIGIIGASLSCITESYFTENFNTVLYCESVASFTSKGMIFSSNVLSSGMSDILFYDSEEISITFSCFNTSNEAYSSVFITNTDSYSGSAIVGDSSFNLPENKAIVSNNHPVSQFFYVNNGGVCPFIQTQEEESPDPTLPPTTPAPIPSTPTTEPTPESTETTATSDAETTSDYETTDTSDVETTGTSDVETTTVYETTDTSIVETTSDYETTDTSDAEATTDNEITDSESTVPDISTSAHITDTPTASISEIESSTDFSEPSSSDPHIVEPTNEPPLTTTQLSLIIVFSIIALIIIIVLIVVLVRHCNKKPAFMPNDNNPVAEDFTPLSL